MKIAETLEAKEETIAKNAKRELEDPMIIEEVEIEELAIDGICGVY